jgi:hypothetical protein
MKYGVQELCEARFYIIVRLKTSSIKYDSICSFMNSLTISFSFGNKMMNFWLEANAAAKETFSLNYMSQTESE